jgi:hypothetical protein
MPDDFPDKIFFVTWTRPEYGVWPHHEQRHTDRESADRQAEGLRNDPTVSNVEVVCYAKQAMS